MSTAPDDPAANPQPAETPPPPPAPPQEQQRSALDDPSHPLHHLRDA
jgi:hypothetical protein